MAKLADFLEKLTLDEDFERRFLADPDAVMKEEHLSETQKNLVLTGTAKEIADAVKNEPPHKTALVIRVKRG